MKNEQISDFEIAYKLMIPHLDIENQEMLKQDFDKFKEQGTWVVHNTFSGGIIFLREPEIINKIKIEFSSELNQATASVEYSSEIRNLRNIKYKPDTGKIESTKWNMLAIFPNFSKYDKPIKIILILIIGKIVKRICEYRNVNSWFMKYEKEFELELELDNELVQKLNVEFDKTELKIIIKPE
jgi:hypothetical protein